MPTINTTGNAEIFYKDWGAGRPVVFSHGWPLTADAWDGQMVCLGQRGYRVIAHDRRSHGRSSQTWDGNDMDTYADDLASLIEALDLRDAVLVGHSTGGGEVAHYIGRHGTSRVAKAVAESTAVSPALDRGAHRRRHGLSSHAPLHATRGAMAIPMTFFKQSGPGGLLGHMARSSPSNMLLEIPAATGPMK